MEDEPNIEGIQDALKSEDPMVRYWAQKAMDNVVDTIKRPTVFHNMKGGGERIGFKRYKWPDERK